MAELPPPALAFTVEGPITRADLPGLCDRVCRLLGEHRPQRAVCDCSSVPADAVTVEALSRLQLGAQRHGCRVELANASPELVELVEFMGLTDVFADARRPLSFD
jgi:ABC-type transporter Mla MlaB component